MQESSDSFVRGNGSTERTAALVWRTQTESRPETRRQRGGSAAITLFEFLTLTSTEQRSEIAGALSACVTRILKHERPVWLESFGILHTARASRTISQAVDGRTLIRKETALQVHFEKCEDFSSLQAEKYPDAVQTGELAAHLHALLPANLREQWQVRTVRRYLRGFCKLLRHECLALGHTKLLEDVGTLYSLRNRNGSNEREWFAGADVFIDSKIEHVVKIESIKMVDTPVLKNAWELFEAAYGNPCNYQLVDLASELSCLGYDTAGWREIGSVLKNFRVAVFRVPGGARTKDSYLYCSDGLRAVGQAANGHSGSEFTFQLPVPANAEDQQPPAWPARALALAWILLHSSRAKCVSPGAGLSCGATITAAESQLTTIFITPLSMCKAPQKSSQGKFSYVNVLGITKAEAALAERLSPAYLQVLLTHKSLDQITYPDRGCMLAHSGHVEGEYAEIGKHSEILQPQSRVA